jgi:hypothetical protein
MTVKEIDTLAKSKSALPIDSAIIEAGLYTKLCQLYGLFDYHEITVDEAKKQKADLFEAFEYENGKDKQISELNDKIERDRKIFEQDDKRRVAISGLMCKANKQGCEICREISRFYDGH